jgi:16S rRNA (uracil1498-N3)-methyltransferase
MSSLFLRVDLAALAPTVGSGVALAGDEARHAITVNRVRVGEVISIGDGNGLMVSGTIATVEPKALEITVETVTAQPSPTIELWLAQALAKGDRDEMAVQAATELGVSGVIPWAAERSISKWTGQKVGKGIERWRAIVREASKQSIRHWIPVVGEHTSSKQLAALGATATVVLLDPTASTRISELELPTVTPGDTPRRLILVVGPEGGISPHEIEMFETAGAKRVRLGTEILRTSTAGPSALAVLNARLNRW